MARHFTPEFGDFVRDAEPRLRQSLVATVGSEAGREATIQALLDVWGNWGGFSDVDEALRSGYQAGCRAVGAMAPPPVSSPRIDHIFYDLPWDERTALLLSVGHGWDEGDVANLLAGSRDDVATRVAGGAEAVQRHLGLARRDRVEQLVVRRAHELDDAVRAVGLVDLAARLKSERSLVLVPTAGRPTGHWWLAIAAAVAMLVIFLPLLTREPVTSEPEAAEEPEETTTTEIFATEPTEEPEGDEPSTVTTAAEPDTPPMLPNEPGTYEVETDLGTWTWTRLDLEEPVGGWNVQRHDGRLYAARDSGEVWTSVDGITWVEMTSPASGVEDAWVDLIAVGEELWATVGHPFREGPQVYRLRGEAWEPLDIPDPALPQITGLTWNGPYFGAAAEHEGVVVVPLSYWGSIDWGAIYGTFEVSSWEEIPPQPPYADYWDGGTTIRIIHPDTGEILDQLMVEVIEGPTFTVEFFREETGELVHTVIVDDAEHGDDLIPRLIWGDQQQSALIVDRGDGFEVVATPWGPEGGDETKVASTPFGLVAATIRYPRDEPDEFALHLWRSTDGVTWESAGSPELGGDIGWAELFEAGDRLVLMVTHQSGYQEEITLWTSSDGIAWAQTNIEMQNAYPELITDTEFGYLLTYRGAAEEVGVWLSEDGVDWSPVEQSPYMTMTSEGFQGLWMDGDRLYVTRWRVEGDSTLWIGELVG